MPFFSASCSVLPARHGERNTHTQYRIQTRESSAHERIFRETYTQRTEPVVDIFLNSVFLTLCCRFFFILLLSLIQVKFVMCSTQLLLRPT